MSFGPTTVDRGGRPANGSGFGIISPDSFDTRTLVPSSRNRRAIFEGLLNIKIIFVYILKKMINERNSISLRRGINQHDI